ncbi:MAG: DUF1073 domain-containing protein [Firmicutes bacterium]|nr:DUF1073 domain-containing protein [Bacillota bacterium]
MKRRTDGYINMLNKYGTAQDNSTAYQPIAEPTVPDMTLTTHYESDGLFAKIIDSPAEEANKHGFDLSFEDRHAKTLILDTLENLDWEQKAVQAVKWARLFGGALGVMLIDDGGELDEPLNYRQIQGIEDLLIFERAIVQPDYTNLHEGKPQYYEVFGNFINNFKVHASRCLIFKNGIVPNMTANPLYQFWGIPEYIRIHRQLRETTTTHANVVKLLERSVQPVYAMNGLANMLATDGGDYEVLKRMQTLDMSRGFTNSIVIDGEGESYEFKTTTLSGLKEATESACNMLSAVTNIPQTVLFGRSPAGMSATGDSDLENWYNYVERIQNLQLKKNLDTLVDVIITGFLHNGKIEKEPFWRIKFNPLWSITDKEQAEIDGKIAQNEQIKAQTMQVYLDMGILSAEEVKAALLGKKVENSEDHLTNGDNRGIVKLDEDYTEWITINGAAVPIDENGDLQGKVGEKIEETSRETQENENNSASKTNAKQASGENSPKQQTAENITKSAKLTSCENMATQKWGVQSCDLTGLDDTAMEQTFAEMNKVFEKFPELKGQLKEIKAVSSSNSDIDVNSFMDTTLDTMRINIDFFGTDNIKQTKKFRREDVENGHAPKGTEDITSIAVHELGHLLEAKLVNKSEPINNRVNAWNDCKYSSKIVDSAIDSVKLTNDEIVRGMHNLDDISKKVAKSTLINQYNNSTLQTQRDPKIASISGYAITLPAETLAEAFTDIWFNGNKANSLSCAIMQEYERMM